MDNYSILWDPNVALPSGAAIEPLANVRLSTVKPYDPYLDGYQFHHGAAIYQYGATLYVSYAVNKRKENTAGETVLVQTSAGDLYVVHSAGSSPNVNNIDLAVVPLAALVG